jgi:hypothetical protein
MKRYLLNTLLILVLLPTRAGVVNAMTPTITPADRSEILNLISNYSHRFDNRDGSGWAQLYTEDGEWIAYPNDADTPVVHLRGTEMLEQYSTERIVMFTKANIVTRHFMVNTLFDVVSSEQVNTSSMAFITWQRPTLKDFKPQPVQSGYYTHIIVKKNDVWKFKRVEVHTNGLYTPEEVYNSTQAQARTE